MAAPLCDIVGHQAHIATLVWRVDMTGCRPVLAKAVFGPFPWSLSHQFLKNLALVVRLGKSTAHAMKRTVSLCIGSVVPKIYINRLVPASPERRTLRTSVGFRLMRCT